MIPTLAVIAPGLLGGSVARAAHARGSAERIVMWARRPEARLKLREQPWVNAVAETPAEAAAGADLVVLAAPVGRMAELAAAIAPALRPGAIVTDVGSVKGELCRALPAVLPGHVCFVGSHPMAGGEKTGWEHAREDLFQGRTCFVTPRTETDAAATATVVRFWDALGSIVVTLDPDAHDEVVAHISHLPQVVATTLCTFLGQKDHGWRNLAGGGLRDTTRIAASDATMWVEILEQNRDEILRALRRFQDELEAFQSALANRDFLELRARLERGKAYRDGFRP